VACPRCSSGRGPCIYRGAGYSMVFVVFLCTWFMLVPVVRDRVISGVQVLLRSHSVED
jgi:hypothetical protein